MRWPTKQMMLVALAAAMVVGGTFVMLEAGVPENVALGSDDGVMRVRVATRQSEMPTLQEHREPPLAAPLFGARYAVTGLPVTDVPAEISVTVPAGAPADTILYARHPSLPLWEVVPDMRQVSGSLSARVTALTEYALGVAENVETPEFASDVDALIAQAPEKAIAYRVALSYRRVSEEKDAPRIVLPARSREGSCGTTLPWNEMELAERERTARVSVDGVPTDLTFILTAFYFTHPDGCPPESSLTPSN